MIKIILEGKKTRFFNKLIYCHNKINLINPIEELKNKENVITKKDLDKILNSKIHFLFLFFDSERTLKDVIKLAQIKGIITILINPNKEFNLNLGTNLFFNKFFSDRQTLLVLNALFYSLLMPGLIGFDYIDFKEVFLSGKKGIVFINKIRKPREEIKGLYAYIFLRKEGTLGEVMRIFSDIQDSLENEKICAKLAGSIANFSKSKAVSILFF